MTCGGVLVHETEQVVMEMVFCECGEEVMQTVSVGCGHGQRVCLRACCDAAGPAVDVVAPEMRVVIYGTLVTGHVAAGVDPGLVTVREASECVAEVELFVVAAVVMGCDTAELGSVSVDALVARPI